MPGGGCAARHPPELGALRANECQADLTAHPAGRWAAVANARRMPADAAITGQSCVFLAMCAEIA
jgi:hypothetical protein